MAATMATWFRRATSGSVARSGTLWPDRYDRRQFAVTVEQIIEALRKTKPSDQSQASDVQAQAKEPRLFKIRRKYPRQKREREEALLLWRLRAGAILERYPILTPSMADWEIEYMLWKVKQTEHGIDLNEALGLYDKQASPFSSTERQERGRGNRKKMDTLLLLSLLLYVWMCAGWLGRRRDARGFVRSSDECVQVWRHQGHGRALLRTESGSRSQVCSLLFFLVPVPPSPCSPWRILRSSFDHPVAVFVCMYRNVNRSPAEKLFLVVQNALTDRWEFPSVQHKASETLRAAAERASAEHLGWTYHDCTQGQPDSSTVREKKKKKEEQQKK